MPASPVGYAETGRTKNRRLAPCGWRLTPLGRPVEQHGADMADRFGRIQAFRADVDAVLNAVATKNAERVIETC